MQLLDLPVEIFYNILFFASLSRGFVRALRLRLVCRSFHHALNLALFRTQLPDRFLFFEPGSYSRWGCHSIHGVKKFWHDLVFDRVRKGDVGPFVKIRPVAEECCIRAGGDFESTLDALCWAALECTTCNVVEGLKIIDSSMDCHLLSAAAHLGHIPLAKQLVEEGCCPFVPNTLFPAPIFLAAFTGNSEMLKLFQKHMKRCHHLRGYIHGIYGAFRGGDINTLELLASADGLPEITHLDLHCQPIASLDMLRFVVSRWSLRLPDLDTLVYNVCYNNVAVVRHLLDQYACSPRLMDRIILLNYAAERGYEEMVNLLLDHGADPNYGKGWPLFGAVYNSGSLVVVRTLLDRGADLRKGFHKFVLSAMLREHTAMLRFLIGKGRCSTYLKTKLKQVASKNGLESMAEVVEQFECDLPNDDANEDDFDDGDEDFWNAVEKLGSRSISEPDLIMLCSEDDSILTCSRMGYQSADTDMADDNVFQDTTRARV
ncbi:ankyrin [Annulohypoxylon truncatum]|uniref:ankyrin n=1 Tax=Annulohypoxylon truncatum TaxID=327061 RepID=UPI0020072EB2|nr:ankyrin [Annulohypoxylon truncatum]KAI1209210.1 ankyrin [Annulohypoxylon truncatum]